MKLYSQRDRPAEAGLPHILEPSDQVKKLKPMIAGGDSNTLKQQMTDQNK